MNFWQALRARVDVQLLASGLAIALVCWTFWELSELARDPQPHGLDTALLLAFRQAGDTAQPIGPWWLEQAMSDITSLGSATVLALITLAAFLYLLIARRIEVALFVLGSVAIGQALSSLLKFGIDRPRPDLVTHLAEVHTTSFPSGHAMVSAVTYLTLGSLLAGTMETRALRIYVFCVAVAATVLIGISRVFLGVHWPSDVLGGWCAGFAWALLCRTAAQFVLARRTRLDAHD